MKKLSLIFGILGVLVFAIYYQHAYNIYPDVNVNMSNYTNYFLYIVISIAFFGLGHNEKTNIKLFCYYAVGEFWGFLALTYIFNELADEQVIMHKVVIAILLTLSTSFIWYLRKLF